MKREKFRLVHRPPAPRRVLDEEVAQIDDGMRMNERQ